jgi:hypothetical protein
VVSRTLVIILALIAAGMRASQGAWVETAGLAALATGLIALRIGDARPDFRKRSRIYAWLFFSMTAMSMLIVLMRQYR